MTLNKFCPVAQGEYYNIKSPRKSQPLFPVFFKVFSFVCAISTFCYYLCLQIPYVDNPSNKQSFCGSYPQQNNCLYHSLAL